MCVCVRMCVCGGEVRGGTCDMAMLVNGWMHEDSSSWSWFNNTTKREESWFKYPAVSLYFFPYELLESIEAVAVS